MLINFFCFFSDSMFSVMNKGYSAKENFKIELKIMIQLNKSAFNVNNVIY